MLSMLESLDERCGVVNSARHRPARYDQLDKPAGEADCGQKDGPSSRV